MSENMTDTQDKGGQSRQEREEWLRHAPEGKLWVCMACGKTVKDIYGEPGSGWDESCFLNSRLIEESRLSRGPDGRVRKIAGEAS